LINLEPIFTGKIEYFVEETSSTNEMASSLLKKSKVIEGTLFRAGHQSQGKGQRGRIWDSLPNQNILASYVFFPSFLKSEEQFCLIKAVSLAVKDLLDEHLFDTVKIKWPNDIYINNLKIAGILIESTVKDSKMGSSIIGIGLNVNQKTFDPAINATSIILETGVGCNISMFVKELSSFLERRYLMLEKDTCSMDREYEDALYLKDTEADYVVNGTLEKRTLVGIDELGQIKLKDQFDDVNAYGLHQVKLVL